MKTQNTYSKQTAKFIATLIQSMPELSSRTMQSLIENPKLLNESLMEALSPFRKVFMTIKVGTGHLTVADFRTDLEKTGRVFHCPVEVLNDAGFEKSVANTEGEVDLIIVPVIELGQSDEELCSGKSIPREEFYRRAKEQGLELLTLEEAFQLRRQLHNQGVGRVLVAATEALHMHGESNTLLAICGSHPGIHNSGIFITPGENASPCSSHSNWVFKKPRK